jgi:rhodanese-related sulfurtransferase
VVSALPASTQRRTLDEALAETRSGLVRLDPPAARDAQLGGAMVVDIRPAAQRQAEGLVPGAFVIERNVLEWRLDPVGDARIPQAPGFDDLVIIICSGGYASSFAAASLQVIGLHRATDLVGGFQAWHEAGLPVLPGG